MICGGFADDKEVDGETAGIVIVLREEVEKMAGCTYKRFDPLTYRTQVVAGTNYSFKVQVDEAEFIRVDIYEPLPHTGEPPRVTNVAAA